MFTIEATSAAARQFPAQFKRAMQWVKDHPFHMTQTKVIAIEGLDGSGKSLLVSNLSKRLSAPVAYALPEELRQHRQHYDTLGADGQQREMRQFYLLGNISAMADIYDGQKQLCIMDRSYATTLSYFYGNLIRLKGAGALDLPSPPIAWPTYLKPDVCIFLHCDEEERLKRLRGRDGSETAEEQDLATNDAMRRTVEYCYRAFDGVQTLDTTHLSPEQVVDAAIALIALQ